MADPFEKPFVDAVRNLIDDALRAEHALIEEWCEKSLTDPEGRGVLIVRRDVKIFESHEMWITLDPSVPWGAIHEMRI